MAESLSVASLAGRAIRYDVQGRADAPVLLFSNSLGTDVRMWDHQVADLAERWRVIRYDTRGHGKSSVPPGPYTISQLAGDVVDLLDHLDIERTHFCGMSLGGLTGLYLALASPDRLLTVAVCSAAARFGTTATWNERIAQLKEGGLPRIVGSVMTRWFTDEFRAHCPDVVRSVERQFLDTPLDGYVACCHTLRDTDLRSVVSEISVPVLVLAGLRDPAVTVEDARWLAEQLANGVYDELPTAHLSNVENPTAFTNRLATFLSA